MPRDASDERVEGLRDEMRSTIVCIKSLRRFLVPKGARGGKTEARGIAMARIVGGEP